MVLVTRRSNQIVFLRRIQDQGNSPVIEVSCNKIGFVFMLQPFQPK